VLRAIVEELQKISKAIRLIFVAHPRTMKNLDESGLLSRMSKTPGIELIDPLPYIEFMNLATQAALVITDSGGLQEETTYLSIPCLTLRENTERPITVSLGTNKLIRPDELEISVDKIMAGDWPAGLCPPLWDGKTADRAVISLRQKLSA